MYNNILVPLDGSHRAERILPFVQELAQKFNSRITLLQVVDLNLSLSLPYETMAYSMAADAERRVKEAEGYLRSLEGSFTCQGLGCRTVVESGAIVDTILEVAQRVNADLIAMASHGRTGLGRVFYGSVASGVLQKADRPLLLVRADE